MNFAWFMKRMKYVRERLRRLLAIRAPDTMNYDDMQLHVIVESLHPWQGTISYTLSPNGTPQIQLSCEFTEQRTRGNCVCLGYMAQFCSQAMILQR